MVTTSVKLKLIFKDEKSKREMNSYFEEYAKIVNFAAKKITELRGSYKTLPHLKVSDDKYEPRIKDVCSVCKKEMGLFKENIKTGEKLCKNCYGRLGLSDKMIRKRLVPRTRPYDGEPPTKVHPSLNIRNAGNVSKTTYHLAVRDALNALNAGKEQRKRKEQFLKMDIKRLQKFREIMEDQSKRESLPLKGRQRTVRYVHKDDAGKNLRGWTMSNIKNKINT